MRSAFPHQQLLSGEQQGGTPAHAVDDDEELFATGCRNLDGRTTWHGGAAGVMEESGGDPGRERGGEALLLRKMIEFSNWGQFVGGGFF